MQRVKGMGRMVNNAAGGQLCAFGSQPAVMLNKEKGWIGNVSGGTWNVSAMHGRLSVVQNWALAGDWLTQALRWFAASVGAGSCV